MTKNGVIALFPNEHKAATFELASQIRTFLEGHGILVVAEDAKAPSIGAKALSSVPPEKIQFLIAMGGDGTMLRLLHHYIHLKAPILGINLGHLGFMADVPIGDLYPSLTDLLEGRYTIDHRLILEGRYGNKTLFGANEMLIHRGANQSLVELSIQVDGLYVNTFVADGILIATPNGSTAYSLAAGGPILSPQLDAVVITPICPHTISNRPIVLPANHAIEIQYLSAYDPVEVRADGIESLHLPSMSSLQVKKAERTFQLVNLQRRDYFSTLRKKLGWSGKLV